MCGSCETVEVMKMQGVPVTTCREEDVWGFPRSGFCRYGLIVCELDHSTTAGLCHPLRGVGWSLVLPFMYRYLKLERGAAIW